MKKHTKEKREGTRKYLHERHSKINFGSENVSEIYRRRSTVEITKRLARENMHSIKALKETSLHSNSGCSLPERRSLNRLSKECRFKALAHNAEIKSGD